MHAHVVHGTTDEVHGGAKVQANESAVLILNVILKCQLMNVPCVCGIGMGRRGVRRERRRMK